MNFLEHRPRGTAWRRLAHWSFEHLPDLLAFGSAMVTAVLAALLAAALGGCGGGVGTGGTGTYAQGPITGFGSIVVGGVHFDQTGARIEDDDGALVDATVLQLGTTVQVNAGPLAMNPSGDNVATATLIRTQRLLVGPLAAASPTAGLAIVLGQTVVVTGDTVFDAAWAGGLAQIGAGSLVEVYGSFDAAMQRYVATRIAPAATGSALRLTGPVNALDAASKTFRIGGQTYSYAALTNTTGLVEGAMARLKLQNDTDGNGRWLVSAQRPAEPLPSDQQHVELRGRVTSVTSSARFSLDTVPVDASVARIDGTVMLGSLVSVSGTASGGSLVASRVTVESGNAAQVFDLQGSITNLDAANKRFVLGGVLVSYANAGVVYTGGSAADLAVGRKLRVLAVLGPSRSALDATLIRFVN